MNSACSYGYVVFLTAFIDAALAMPDAQVIHKGENELTGWEIKYGLTPNVAYRLGGHDRVGFKRKGTGVAQAHAQFNNKVISVMMDWHPFTNGFRVSTGLFFTAKSLELYAEPGVYERFQTREYHIDKSSWPEEIVIDPADFELNIETDIEPVTVSKHDIPDKIVIKEGSLEIDRNDLNISAKVRFNNLSPYIGFGWGNRPQSAKKFHYSCDIGLLYHGMPEINLGIDGKIVNIDQRLTDKVNEYVFEQQQQLQHKAGGMRLMPYFSVGASLNF